MMLKREPLKKILWILVISLGLLLRLAKLGAAPLTEWEAGNALQVLSWVRSGVLPTGTQAGYSLAGSLVFFLFGSSNFAARLIPALAGSLLVLTPYLYRGMLGKWPALIAAFAIALDPALLAISRQADGASWAMTFTMLALGFALNGRKRWAGICLGLALLGGPALWMGWLGLGIAALLFGRIDSLRTNSGAQTLTSRESLLTALVTLAAAGTLFLFAPFGLSMAAGSLADFFHGWSNQGGLSLKTGAAALLTYAWLPLILGTVRAVSGWIKRDRLDQFLSFWWLFAVLLWLAYPGRQLSDAGWMMLPMCVLAARQAAQWMWRPNVNLLFSVATGAVVFVLLFFMVMNAVAILHPMSWSAQIELQIVKIVVALAILVLAVVLVGWGWSWDSAWQGLQWGAGAALLLILISMSVRAAGLSKKPQAEIWRSGFYFADADLLDQTLQDLSEYKIGQPNNVQIAVVGLHSSSLEWMLRDNPHVQYTDGITSMETPDVIIAGDQIQPGQISSYRGQDFRWMVAPAWESMTSDEWLSWLVFREYPEESSRLILWARTDLFPGENAAQTAP